MVNSILSTKLYILPARPNLVARQHLFQRLEEGVAQGRRLSLISAPAGYGKSVLAATWLRKQADKETPRAMVSWLSLDANDNDPVRFFSYLAAAAKILAPESVFPSLLPSPHPPPPAELMTSFINELAGSDIEPVQEGLLLLALDDYHKIHSPYIHDCLQFLLDYAPPNLHLVLITRQDPPLALPRMRVAGELTEIRAQDLRFSGPEIGQFFNLSNNMELEQDWVETLEVRTEGWVAGLQLAALSLRDRSDVGVFLDDFRGTNRYLIDYLIDEVLSQLPEETRQFLYQTSILDRLSAGLCQALTGRGDSQEILQQLENDNLFLIPLDDRREWYRYHHLFSDFLRTELKEPHLAELHRKAATWYEANGLTPEAVQHALASKDNELAGDLVERAMLNPTTWSSGQLGMLLGWVEALPDESVYSRPQLAIRASRALYLSGQLELAAQMLDKAEISLRSRPSPVEDIKVSLAQIFAFRAAILALQGHISEAREMVQQALIDLPVDYLLARARAWDTLGLIHQLTGSMEDAIAAFMAASQVAMQAGVLFLGINACCEAALVQIIQGRLNQAQRTCRQALQLPGPESGRIPPTGLAWAILADIALERNDLETAERYLSDAIQLSQEGGIIDDLKMEYLILAHLRLAQADPGGAIAAVQRAITILQTYSGSPLLGQSTIIQAYLDLKLGNPASAAAWAREYEHSRNSEAVDYLREFEDLTLARFMLAEGRPQEAQALLEELVAAARAGQRLKIVIEGQTLTAIAWWDMQDKVPAFAALEEALYLGRPEGFVRTFINEGEALRALLAGLIPVLKDQTLREYAKYLLANFSDSTEQSDESSLTGVDGRPISTVEMIEPLSEQELKILRLLSAGLSNKEIATELVIGVGTVKWHVHNIYGKLGVNSRTQAIARAQELGILN